MRNLLAADLNNVLNVGQLSLECNTLDELQNDALHAMQQSLSASSCVYMSIRRKDGRVSFRGNKAHGHPESEMNKWCNRYQPQDPFVSHYLNEFATRPSNVVVSNQVVSEQEYLTSRFYNDFLRPMSIYHVMVVGLSYQGSPFGILGFHRPKSSSAFSDRAIAMAELMSPHLAAAIQKAQVCEQVTEREWLIDELVTDNLNDGVIILDNSMTPVYVSSSISNLLAKHSTPTPFSMNSQSLLPPALVERCMKLKKSIERGVDDEDLKNFQLPIGVNGEPIEISLRPINCGQEGFRIMVCFKEITERKMPTNHIKRFGLTARQIDIAQLVGLGLTNADIADKLCISTRTVENHLRSIYEKAGVNNRTSLAYRLTH